ncbi:MAG: uracil-DNA glycosylase [Nitrosopumilaceae archaeon]
MSTKSLDGIRKKVVSCTKCDLCHDRINSVPGKGTKDSKIIFIGEAPGRSEDRQGEPFVGAAGKKLSIALEYAGISRDSIYITNVVKCRPPNNRVPTQVEQDACSEYLKAEIALIKPKVICIMGNTAFNSLLGGNNITKNRGKIVTRDGMRYFLTVHPAAAIYNQELLEVLKEDMKKLVQIISDI